MSARSASRLLALAAVAALIQSAYAGSDAIASAPPAQPAIKNSSSERLPASESTPPAQTQPQWQEPKP